MDQELVDIEKGRILGNVLTELATCKTALEAIAKVVMPPADTRREIRFQNLLYSMRDIAREAIGIDSEADIAEHCVDHEARFRALEADAARWRKIAPFLVLGKYHDHWMMELKLVDGPLPIDSIEAAIDSLPEEGT